MPADFVRAVSNRTGKKLPYAVPRSHLEIFNLRETASSKRNTEQVTEPVQPAAEAPVTEPETPATKTGKTNITEPARPDKNKE